MPSLLIRAVAADIVAAVAKITIAAANAAMTTTIANAKDMANIMNIITSIIMKVNAIATSIIMNTKNLLLKHIVSLV